MNFQNLNDDMVLYIALFFKKISYNKVLFNITIYPIEIYFLKLTCKNFYNCLKQKKYIEFYNNDIIKTLYYNEIAKIGNEKMFKEFINVYIYKTYDEIITNACIYNHPNVLEWYFNKNKNFEKDTCEEKIVFACFHGNTDVLDWFHSKNILKYNYNALNFAVIKNRINIIYWFIDHPEYEFKCNSSAIMHASENGNIEILDLLIKHSKYLKNLVKPPHTHIFIQCYCYSIKCACKNGHINVLEWFKNKFNAICCIPEIIHNASENNHIHILDWYKNNNCDINFNPLIINRCSDKVQKWFDDYIIEMVNNKTSI